MVKHRNLYLLILDNGLYEVTGGEPTTGAGAWTGGAGTSGWRLWVTGSDAVADWQGMAAEVLTGPGPVVAWLKVQGKYGQTTPKAPRPMAEQLEPIATDAG